MKAHARVSVRGIGVVLCLGVLASNAHAHTTVSLAGMQPVDDIVVDSRKIDFNPFNSYETYVVTFSNSGRKPLRGPLYLAVENISPASASVILPGTRSSEGVPFHHILDPVLSPGERHARVVVFRKPRRNTVLRFSSRAYRPASGPGNTPPVAEAGPDITAYVGDAVTLDGSGSTDLDGDILSYRWSLDSVPPGSSAVVSGNSGPRSGFTVDAFGDYVAELVVNDGHVDSIPDTVRISTLNSIPVAHAGPDQTVSVGDTVLLDGSGSTDADGDSLGYQWILVERPEQSLAILDNPFIERPAFYVDQPGAYALDLIVDDGRQSGPPDRVVITTRNSRPVAHAGEDIHAFIGDMITLDGGRSGDVDLDPLGYRWSLVGIPPGSGATLQDGDTVNPVLVADVEGVYVVQLIVGDGLLDSEPDTVQVDVAADVIRDTDGDGIPDARERILGTDPGSADSDGDGLSDGDEVDLHHTDPLDPDSDGDGLSDGAEVGRFFTDPLNADTDGDGFDDGAETEAGSNPKQGGDIPGGVLPPDPGSIAPPLDPTIATNLSESVSFLYTGSNPVQTGMSPETINPRRAAVARGLVLDRANRPLSGVSVTVRGRPEYGRTLTRPDGMFDLVVNGGGYLTMDYERQGYLPVRRTVEMPWQDYMVFPDVVMIPVDPSVTTIEMNSPGMQIVRGSVVTDADGVRRATLLFPRGTTAEMRMPDGSARGLATLNVRATEYTVGTNGILAMPAELPPTSGYTYAVDFSVDEARAAGAEGVQFNQPVIAYVDNFLDLPVGWIVPSGHYDRGRAAWVASRNGLIIRILGVSNGLTSLDIDGSGVPADVASLEALGIGDEERQQLASLYAGGESLWRVPIDHFSPWDFNWPFGPPVDADVPRVDVLAEGSEKLDSPECRGGSIIECQNQILGERMAVAGTPFSLNYRSDRVPGRKTANNLQIRISGDTLPASLRSIIMRVRVGGRLFRQTYPPAVNQTVTFTWDGEDAYGRRMQGLQNAYVEVEYVYPLIYYRPSMEEAFSRISIAGLNRDEISRRGDVRVVYGQYLKLASSDTWDARGQGFGGWTLSAHHFYDPNGQILQQGDGARRSADNRYLELNRVIAPVAGDGSPGHGGDGGPALKARLESPEDVAVGDDGSVYIADPVDHRVRRIAPDGVISTYAGTGIPGFSGDGGPAASAQFDEPSRVSIGADGALYIGDTGNQRIRRVGADGIVTTVVGSGESLPGEGFIVSGCPGEADPETGRPIGISGEDGCLATDFMLSFSTDVAFGPDGRMYVAERNRIFEITPAGIVRYFAGTGQNGYNGDGIPALQAQLTAIDDLVVSSDGSLIFSEPNNQRVRRIDPAGIIHTYAGTGVFGFSGDGGPATSAALRNPGGLAISADGGLLVADTTNQRIRKIGPDGVINTVVGNGLGGSISDNSLPMNTAIYVGRIATGPDGNIYSPQLEDSRVYVVAELYPRFSGGNISIPSSDGGEIHRFDQYGRHLDTVNAYTGATLYRFGYDDAGYLTEIEDGDGNRTSIERDPVDHGVVAIDSPDHLRTTVTLTADGYLASLIDPMGEAHEFTYLPGGLLQGVMDPRNNRSLMSYDAFGRLMRDEDGLGGYWDLSRVSLPRGHQVNMTSALGRTTVYQTEEIIFNPLDVSAVGGEIRRIIHPDGTQTRRISYDDGRATSVEVDGTVISMQSGPDPRLGMLAPVMTRMATTTPSGLSSDMSAGRTIIPATDLIVNDTFGINGRVTSSVYDVAANTHTITTPESRVSVVETDEQGRVLERAVTGLDPVSYRYDSRGRLVTIAQGAGVEARSITMSYGTGGFLDMVTDAMGRITDFDHDPAGRITRQILPGDRTIDYAYDPNGNLVSILPPGREAHLFEYTATDLEAQYLPPDLPGITTVTRYHYNLDRQPALIERPDGQSVTYEYDSGGRLSALDFSRGRYLYAYEPTTGQLTRIAAPGVDLGYTWDGFLPMSETMNGEVNGTVSHAYDNNFWRTGIGVNDDMIGYGYDNDGLMTSAGSLSMVYDASNGLLSGTSLAGITTEDTYNTFAELAGHTAGIDGNPIAGYEYGRDALGRITNKTETLGGVSISESYTYSQAGYLTSMTRNGVSTTWGYDANGNRTHRNGALVAVYDAQDRLLSFGAADYTYTGSGDLASKTEEGATTVYAYDALGNLRHVGLPGDVDIDYVIDGRNRRVGKKVGGILIQGFLYQDQLSPVAELDGSGNVVSRFIYGDKPNVPGYMIRNGTTYRILSDHLGSPRLVVNVEDGSVAQRIDYDAWGRVVNDTNPGFQPFGFAGGLLDQHTGLVRFGARDYDPKTGRWTTKDPIRFHGGDPNLYGYVLNDPINLVDPDGRVIPVIPAVLGGFAIGVLAGGSTTALSGGTWSDVAKSAISGGLGGASLAVSASGIPGLAKTMSGIMFDLAVQAGLISWSVSDIFSDELGVGPEQCH